MAKPKESLQAFRGRSGVVEFVDQGRAGQFEWEILLGEANIGVFAESCQWTEEATPMTRDEMEQFLQEFAADSGMKVLITFPDKEWIIAP